MATATNAPPLASLRGATAGLVAFAGAVHLLVASQRGVLWPAEGAALAAWGVVQIAAAFALVTTARSLAWSVVSVAGTAAAAAWLFTRTAGYPFGPFSSQTPPTHGLEVAVAVAELIAAAIAGAVLLTDGRVGGPSGLRFENLTVLALVAASIPGVAASSWLEAYGVDPTTGTTHVHAPVSSNGIPLTTEERRELGDELDVARALAQSHPTLADARSAGLVVSGAPAVGVGVQVFDPTTALDGPFDPSTPRAWIYANGADDAPVVGLLYDLVGADAPAGFTGETDAWHLHPGECAVALADGSTLHVPLDPVVTGNSCEPVDGVLGDRVHWMLRVWVSSGWENPNGVFAHDHPALPAT